MYSQTMAARFDCKKLLRFALATLCLLALAMLMPVAARAEETDKSKETTKWEAKNENGDTLYATFERNGTAKEPERKQGKVNLEVYVMKPGKVAYSKNSSVDDYYKYTTTFNYQYNANEDKNLSFHTDSRTFDKLEKTDDDKYGNGKGGYGSLDLKVTAGEGYTIYRVDYSVCHSSEGPTKTGWKTEEFNVKKNEPGPTRYCYLDNIQDDTIAKVYLMPTYKVQYKVIDENGNNANTDTYSVADGKNLKDVTVLPYKENLDNITGCNVLKEKIESYKYNTGSIAPYHRWCNEENEKKAVEDVKTVLGYNANTSVELPVLKAAEGYTVSAAWKHGDQEYSGTLDLSTLSATDFEALANDENNPLTITLTAVVTADKPENTDNSGNNNGNGDNGGNNNGDNNNNGGDNGNNGGQESTTTPAPETTPAPTASVTTVTAVAPTATPTATPAPTAEPTATPAPAAVSAHIPQTSDDMPYTLLVVTALASLCAAGALFMKRRSK